mgnify:CR=1 FL=1
MPAGLGATASGAGRHPDPRENITFSVKNFVGGFRGGDTILELI